MCTIAQKKMQLNHVGSLTGIQDYWNLMEFAVIHWNLLEFTGMHELRQDQENELHAFLFQIFQIFKTVNLFFLQATLREAVVSRDI